MDIENLSFAIRIRARPESKKSKKGTEDGLRRLRLSIFSTYLYMRLHGGIFTENGRLRQVTFRLNRTYSCEVLDEVCGDFQNRNSSEIVVWTPQAVTFDYKKPTVLNNRRTSHAVCSLRNVMFRISKTLSFAVLRIGAFADCW